MTLNINQQFVVEISRPAVGPELLAKNLASAITSWEREFNEEDEDENHGFLVPEDEDEAEDDEEEGAEEGEGEDEEEPEADSTLYVTATLNKEVLREIKELQESEDASLLRIAFVYGNEQVGTIRREFDVDGDMFMSFGSGVKDTTDLVVGLTFDVYDSSTNF